MELDMVQVKKQTAQTDCEDLLPPISVVKMERLVGYGLLDVNIRIVLG
jgi:hypothetical protein